MRPELDAIKARLQAIAEHDSRGELSGADVVALTVDLTQLIGRVEELETQEQHRLNTTYCAYCGYEVTGLTGDDSAAQVAEHIRTCEKHPSGQRIRWLGTELLRMDSENTKHRVEAERLRKEIGPDGTAIYAAVQTMYQEWCKDDASAECRAAQEAVINAWDKMLG